MKTRLLTTLTIVAATSVITTTTDPRPAHAATIGASYDVGYRDVLINGFGTDGLGTFRLDDGDNSAVALCIEADQPHTTVQDAYSPVDAIVSSAHLDALIWLIERSPLDDDTATAAAALAWQYAGAERPGGIPVWGDGTRSFAPIGPLDPEPWDALAAFSLEHPIGLRAGTTDLDAAERRVADLHRRVEAIRGPWQLDVDDTSQQFVLLGHNGPIAGQSIRITATTPGAAPVEYEVVTDEHGHPAVEVTGYRDGATLTAIVDAPGPHREWDGAGEVQRMVTATTISLQAELVIAPLPRHVRVLKRSTDPTIGVAGGIFALRDAVGSEIARATSDANGWADFAPTDPTRHPLPYSVAELAAPPALRRSNVEHTVVDASTDSNDPTVVQFDNDPATVEIVVEKQLSNPAAGGSDRSDFVFEVVRSQDGWTEWLITAVDGMTNPVDLALGTYQICETAVPEWAAGLIDGGCRDVDIGLEQLTAGDRISVPYLNEVPPPSIDTTAYDASDGDQTLTVEGGVVIDEAWLTDLIPGSTYTLIAELVNLAGDGTPTVIDRVEAEFVAESTLSMAPIRFEVPPLEPTTLVVVDALLLGDELVAVHDDLTDPDQTVTVAAPPTTSTTTSPTITAPTKTSTTVAVPTEVAPTTTVTVTAPPPPANPAPVKTLPRTGDDDARQLLRIGDIGFAAGVALIAMAGLLPRRAARSTA